MSEQRVAAVTRQDAEALVAALNARDFEAIEELRAWDPALEFRSALAVADGETYRGIEGIRRWAENADATWASFRVELADFRVASGERVVVVYHVTGRALASGVPLDTFTSQVWTMREGRIQHIDSYTHPAEALEASGLPE